MSTQQSYALNTNMIWFRWFLKKLLWMKLASALEGLCAMSFATVIWSNTNVHIEKPHSFILKIVNVGKGLYYLVEMEKIYSVFVYDPPSPPAIV